MLQVFEYHRTTTGRLLISLIVFVTLLFAGACASSEGKGNNSDRIVAKVFNKSLSQSELNDLIVDGTSTEDSSQIVNAYIDKWVREAVLMHEAEKYVPKDLNIDELVRDYRASLIRYNYEKLLVELNLDSLINESELSTFYEENKEQYKLDQPIIKCQFIKLSKSVEGYDEVKKWWNSNKEDDYKKLLEYCMHNAQVYMMSDSSWYKLSEISQYMPDEKLSTNNYKSRKNYTTTDDDYYYFLRIEDSVPTGNYPPLEFIRDHASKVILHKRKISLLEENKEEMFERETGKNNVKIFVE